VSNRLPTNAPALDPPGQALRGPTLAVWIASFFVALHCLTNLLVGLIEVGLGAIEWANPPPNALTPLVDPFFAGMLNLSVAGFLGWCQYSAVSHRSRARCYLVGAVFFVLAVLGSMSPWGTPWDAAHYVMVGSALFIGISMVRWGGQLASRPGQH
jgi:hypothetical protein